ncbi:histidine phosphatase family protein [Propionivibrio dicarboxylicus]|uniref:histidine phosphatase family protein n=1 Tax=Propionivibrio dicarboxylicus TaxID=83767 RepID=UPI00115F7F97|nr:histidine phosphatase family protein [Propionivibrio dicarboxylicus]
MAGQSGGRLWLVAPALLWLPASAFAAPEAPSHAVSTPPVAAARFDERPADAALIAELRGGGFVLFLVNAPTERGPNVASQAFDVNDCSTQRVVSPEGRRIATQLGEAMRLARIPIEDMRVGPLCQARETAALAFPGQVFAVDPKLLHTPYLTEADKLPIIANTRLLLSLPVLPGGNRMLIAQAPNLMDVIGYFPREATLVIFRPKGGKDGFDYIASIMPASWPALSRALSPASPR